MQFRAKPGEKVRMGPALHSAKNCTRPTMSLPPELAEGNRECQSHLYGKVQEQTGSKSLKENSFEISKHVI